MTMIGDGHRTPQGVRPRCDETTTATLQRLASRTALAFLVAAFWPEPYARSLFILFYAMASLKVILAALWREGLPRTSLTGWDEAMVYMLLSYVALWASGDDEPPWRLE